ncbi:MAG: phosphatase PAP2 family protein [Deltaproteobacteria bacterium]
MNSHLKFAILISFASACTDSRASARPNPSSADPSSADPGAAVVVAWNRRLVGIAQAEDHFLTLKGLRALAMMHLAVHDALNAIRPRYAAYAYRMQADGADPSAAVARAAYEVVAHEYPNVNAELETELAAWLAPLPEGPAKSSGNALGRAAAAEILKVRQGDGWDAEGEYQLQPAGPGVYRAFPEHSGTPPGFVFGSGWGRARPFLLREAQQFRPAPPPAIDGTAYAAAFAEVKELGRLDSPTRTEEQTHIAFWWKDFAENSLNRLAAQSAPRPLDLWASARLFALLNASIFDGYVSAFESKFHYNHWRPYTAIRAAASDGNPSTAPDPNWDDTHQHTYPFPSYPSAHGTVCAAGLRVFENVFGDAQPFRMTTLQVNAAGPMSPLLRMEPAERSFERFSAAARECALSRVYLGIHFRHDAEAGTELGTLVAQYAWDHFLQPK